MIYWFMFIRVLVVPGSVWKA